MKLTIVCDRRGRVVGAARMHQDGRLTAGVVPVTGQTHHEVDVDPELAATWRSNADMFKGLAGLVKSRPKSRPAKRRRAK